MRGGRVITRIATAASLLAAAAILAVGCFWLGFVWSGGEYASPRPSLGHKIGEALPWALGTVVVAAISGIIGVILIVASRPAALADRGSPLKRLSALLGLLIAVGLVFVAWAAEGWTGSYYAPLFLLYVAVVDAFLILLVATHEVAILVRGRSAFRNA